MQRVGRDLGWEGWRPLLLRLGIGILRVARADDVEVAELTRGVVSSAASCAGGESLRVLVTGTASGAGAERRGGRA
jgi:hypothetical protein